MRWLTVTNREDVFHYCAACAAPLLVGDQVRRIEGGYGYICRSCAARVVNTPVGGKEQEEKR